MKDLQSLSEKDQLRQNGMDMLIELGVIQSGNGWDVFNLSNELSNF